MKNNLYDYTQNRIKIAKIYILELFTGLNSEQAIS